MESFLSSFLKSGLGLPVASLGNFKLCSQLSDSKDSFLRKLKWTVVLTSVSCVENSEGRRVISSCLGARPGEKCHT